MDVDDDWDNFCKGEYKIGDIKVTQEISEPPICGELYISTITKLAYLDSNIPLDLIFWDIPVICYDSQTEGIIKKEMKFNCSTLEEFDVIQKKIPNELYVEQHVLIHIDNSIGRIKFKDSRKISIGLCKKDILSSRAKKKGAFYNCFVLIMRIFDENVFKDIHIKVFNTGNIKIPGIKNDHMFELVIKKLLILINGSAVFRDNPIRYLSDRTETVLINSNFNCGYFINREKLYDIIKNKYEMCCSYDPCSYPGIHIEYYYDTTKSQYEQSGRKPINIDDSIHMHIKVFRTGSCLILGKCSMLTIECIYRSIAHIFMSEYKKLI